MFEMSDAQQRPFRCTGDQRQQKTALALIQSLLEFAHQPFAAREQRVERSFGAPPKGTSFGASPEGTSFGARLS